MSKKKRAHHEVIFDDLASEVLSGQKPGKMIQLLNQVQDEHIHVDFSQVDASSGNTLLMQSLENAMKFPKRVYTQTTPSGLRCRTDIFVTVVPSPFYEKLSRKSMVKPGSTECARKPTLFTPRLLLPPNPREEAAAALLFTARFL
jgi:hypothetical protein